MGHIASANMLVIIASKHLLLTSYLLKFQSIFSLKFNKLIIFYSWILK